MQRDIASALQRFPPTNPTVPENISISSGTLDSKATPTLPKRNQMMFGARKIRYEHYQILPYPNLCYFLDGGNTHYLCIGIEVFANQQTLLFQDLNFCHAGSNEHLCWYHSSVKNAKPTGSKLSTTVNHGWRWGPVVKVVILCKLIWGWSLCFVIGHCQSGLGRGLKLSTDGVK